jgi:hypothetical protein
VSENDPIAGDLVATPMNGPTCSSEGISLDGSDDYVDINDWTWGGTTSFEVLVKYDSFNSGSRVFDFGNGESDNVILSNYHTTSTIRWSVIQGSGIKYLEGSNFDSSTWTHVVVTVSGTTMKMYKNGVLVGTKTDGHEPNVLTRTQHWLGRSAWSSDGYFDGTIAYVKMWHGVELHLSDVDELWNVLPEVCPAGKHNPTQTKGAASCVLCDAGKFSEENSSDCTACKAGSYASSVGSSVCHLCDAGKYS